MKSLILVVFGLFQLGALAANETLMQWTNSPRDMMGDRMYFSRNKEALFLAAYDPETVSPDGGKTIRYTALEQLPGEALHMKMVSCLNLTPLLSGKTYRLTFFCKASEAMQFRVECGMANKPYTKIPGAYWILKADTEWRKIKLEFTPRKDFTGRTVTPRFLFGELPLKANLWIGPVTLSRIELPDTKVDDKRNLRPTSPMSMILPPDIMTNITLKVQGFDNKSIAYEILNYSGDKIGVSGSVVPSDGKVTIQLKLQRGFYELYFPECGQRLGLEVSARQTAQDPYWGVNTGFQGRAPIYTNRRNNRNYMDGAFEDISMIEEYCRFLNYAGITQLREFCGFIFRSAQEGKIKYNNERMEQILSLMGKYHLRFLTYYQTFPEYLGAEFRRDKNSPFPKQTMVRFFDKLEHPLKFMLEKEKDVVSGLQIYNEQDMVAKNTPPDTVSSLTWAVRRWQEQLGLTYPLVGMSFCGVGIEGMFPESYWKIYQENGYWDNIEAFALNYYLSPKRLRKVLEYNMIKLIRHSQAPHPKFMITESNRWFLISGRRAPISEDKLMANWTIRKAVVAKAYGVEKYFAFCLLFYDEKATGKNFGMFDFYQTPHRLCSAYMTAATELNNTVYLGDLPTVEGFDPIHVFARGNETIAVLASNAEPLVYLKDFNAKDLIHIDGAKADCKSAKLYGGVGYLKLSDRSQIQLNTQAMEFCKIFRTSGQRAVKSYPVVLRFHYEDFDRNFECYYLKSPKFRVNVTAFNFDNSEQEICPELSMAGNIMPSKKIVVPPNASKKLSWNLDMGNASIANVKITAPSGNASPLAMVFRRRMDAEIPITGTSNPKNWRKNCNGNDMTIEWDPQDKAMRFTARFSMTGNHWFFPRYIMLPSESLRNAKELIYEIKADSSTERMAKNIVYFMQKSQPHKYGVRAEKSGVSADGWQIYKVNLNIPEDVYAFEIGVYPAPKVSTLQVRNIRIQ